MKEPTNLRDIIPQTAIITLKLQLRPTQKAFLPPVLSLSPECSAMIWGAPDEMLNPSGDWPPNATTEDYEEMLKTIGLHLCELVAAEMGLDQPVVG